MESSWECLKHVYKSSDSQSIIIIIIMFEIYYIFNSTEWLDHYQSIFNNMQITIRFYIIQLALIVIHKQYSQQQSENC